MPPPISYGDAIEIAKHGSPMLLQAVGRAFGLGAEEREALSQRSGIPWWLWVTAGIAGGFVAGVQVYRRWPTAVPAVIGGRASRRKR